MSVYCGHAQKFVRNFKPFACIIKPLCRKVNREISCHFSVIYCCKKASGCVKISSMRKLSLISMNFCEYAQVAANGFVGKIESQIVLLTGNALRGMLFLSQACNRLHLFLISNFLQRNSLCKNKNRVYIFNNSHFYLVEFV